MEGDSDIVDVVSRPSPAIRRKGGRVGDFAHHVPRVSCCTMLHHTVLLCGWVGFIVIERRR